jgi:hypothetical protein
MNPMRGDMPAFSRQTLGCLLYIEMREVIPAPNFLCPPSTPSMHSSE